MIRFNSICLILMLAIASLVTFSQEPQSKSEPDESVVEAVFRYQMAKCSSMRSGPVVFFLDDRGKDPSDKFMRRFENSQSPVKKRSEMGKLELTNEFMDKESGKFGALLSVDKLTLLGDAKAEVEGSCGFASWAANFYKYSVVLKEKAWVVESAELIGMF